MSAMMKVIQRLYPKAVKATIVQVFVPGRGWKDVKPKPLAEATLHVAVLAGAYTLSLELEDRHGRVITRFVDWQVREFLPERSYSSALHATKAYARAVGIKGTVGGWLYAGASERALCQGWIALELELRRKGVLRRADAGWQVGPAKAQEVGAA